MSNAGQPRFSGEGFLLACQEMQPEAQVARQPTPPTSPRRMRRIALWLAIATVFSTFWAGVGAWVPTAPIMHALDSGSLMPIRQALLANWWEGLQFSLGLMAILVAHELGHYVLTLVYRVPSTPPLFIPFPFLSPIGTMGAVIMMQSGTADRKQIFDIGLAGPLAGLVVALPVLILGIVWADPVPLAPDEALVMGQPLLIQWLAGWLMPDKASEFVSMANTQASPLLMAGWVGLLVTGLNMMPLGQLDGGHVAFGLLGPKSYWVAIAAFSAALGYMLYSQIMIFSLMLVLVLLMGLRHPPSSDDTRALGIPRQIIGWLSLVLPLLCIPANPLSPI
ncbi:site-2 protease family protein [Aureliella helgolandensis]|uniref:Peptidase family M50 n=1 Tax=Aureliella helgolandensis TaxID=2527968 RepID=A0A518GDA8_9BACT|nr:site-2 protease family protein [Aureliella helgolandensis]QDV26584.1 Peptidase family M50 [Aureliella helgolandensis]